MQYLYEIITQGRVLSYNESGDEDEQSIKEYKSFINEAIEDDWKTMPKNGLAYYIGKSENLYRKIINIPAPKIKYVKNKDKYENFNKFNLVWTIAANKKLTKKEQEELVDYIEGQNSDGWGEGFEQQEITRYKSSYEEWDDEL